MTLNQLKRTQELADKGYVDLGPAAFVMGGPTRMRAPDGAVWIVQPDGSAALEASESCVEPSSGCVFQDIDVDCLDSSCRVCKK